MSQKANMVFRNRRRRFSIAAILISIVILISIGLFVFNIQTITDEVNVNDVKVDDVNVDEKPANNIAADFRKGSRQARPGVPYQYPAEEQVDIRILILTHNRHASLQKLLVSVQELEMDGDTAAIEIWIDRNKSNNVSEEVVTLAKKFQTDHDGGGGRVHVNVQEKHVGIMGQWLDTWRPRPSSTAPRGTSPSSHDELVLILEDDMTLSPYAYRWLRAAHRFYVNRSDLAGITLQSNDFIVAKTGAKWTPPTKSLTFMYLVSSWGFAPRASVWRQFQDWFKQYVTDPKFRPYVKGIISTDWYKTFEKQGREHSMWTMWFIYYCHYNKLYTLYSNLNGYTGSRNSCLSVNRLEDGLHYLGKGVNNTGLLLRSWKDEYVKFDQAVPLYQFNGKILN